MRVFTTLIFLWTKILNPDPSSLRERVTVVKFTINAGEGVDKIQKIVNNVDIGKRPKEVSVSIGLSSLP